MSSHPSARMGVPCAKCGAASDEPCRSLATRRTTDTHAARFEAVAEARRAMYVPATPRSDHPDTSQETTDE